MEESWLRVFQTTVSGFINKQGLKESTDDETANRRKNVQGLIQELSNSSSTEDHATKISATWTANIDDEIKIFDNNFFSNEPVTRSTLERRNLGAGIT